MKFRESRAKGELPVGETRSDPQLIVLNKETFHFSPLDTLLSMV